MPGSFAALSAPLAAGPAGSVIVIGVLVLIAVGAVALLPILALVTGGGLSRRRRRRFARRDRGRSGLPRDPFDRDLEPR